MVVRTSRQVGEAHQPIHKATLTTGPHLTPLSQLCVSCGLCCDGSIFGFVALSNDEPERLEKLPVQIDRLGDRSSLRLPCHALKNRCCSVYAERPSGCRTFVCKLGEHLTHGNLTSGECSEVVAEAIDRIHDVGISLKLDRDVMTRAQRLAQNSAAPLSDEQLDLLRSTQVFIRTHFLGWQHDAADKSSH